MGPHAGRYGFAVHVGQDLLRLRLHLRRPVSRLPHVWDAAMQTRPGKRATLARSDTALVIEGFPARATPSASPPSRSRTDRSRTSAGISTEHRTCCGPSGSAYPPSPWCERREDAVPSYLIRRAGLHAEDALVEYLDFYRTAWPARDAFVVGLFDDVVGDFGAVIDRVNRRFGTAFARYEATPENEAAAFELVEEMNRLESGGEVVETHVGRPSAERNARKAEIAASLERPRAARLLHEAQQLFAQYVALGTEGRDVA